MAFMDYGAIAFKNGKLISTEMFTPMKDMVGWEDTEKDTYTHYELSGNIKLPLRLKDNYFAYVGDEDCTIAFFKESIIITEKLSWGDFMRHYESFGNTSAYYKWSKYDWFAGRKKIKVTKRNGYYVCKWKYKGDKYKVYFGYGVDLGYYKKWHIVNYYRSPQHLVCRAVCKIKDKIDDFKWSHGWE